MKKVGARILLCLMLVTALVTSTLTAFAEPNTTETPEGLDLSKFKTVDLKDVGGVHDGNFYLRDGLTYLFAYYDSSSYYIYTKSGDYSDDSFKSISVDNLSNYILSKENYTNCIYGSRDGYTLLDTTNSLNINSRGMNFYILLTDGSNFYNAGKYSNFNDLVKYSEIKFSDGLPVLDVSVEKESNTTASIIVKFSSSIGVRSLVCRFEDGDIKENYDVPEDDFKDGVYSFKVTTNGTYKIEGYNQVYLDDSDTHSSIDVVVEGLEDMKPNEVSNTSKDTKAPKVTFSKLPKSALVNSDVEITMYSDKPAKLVFNGQASDGYVKKMKVKVTCNGKYAYSASDKDSNQKSGKLNVKFFKNGRAFEDEDRDNFWNNPNSPISTITSKLPQTGSVGWYWMIAFGVALVGVGGFVVFKATKSRKNKGIENK